MIDVDLTLRVAGREAVQLAQLDSMRKFSSGLQTWPASDGSLIAMVDV